MPSKDRRLAEAAGGAPYVAPLIVPLLPVPGELGSAAGHPSRPRTRSASTSPAGGVVVFDTVTDTSADVALLPAPSVRDSGELVRAVGHRRRVPRHAVGRGRIGAGPRFAPSSLNCTSTIAAVSAASADTATVPETVADAAGAVIEMVGGALSTLTVTGADSVALPAASVAWAVSTCAPDNPVVFQDAEYGKVVSGAPSATPLTRNCTPVTPVSSLAVARIETLPRTQLPATGAVTPTVGAVVSGGRTYVAV